MSGTLNLKQIDAFRWVMISGSTSEAAKILNVSQPAISRLIRNLEGQVNYPLFERRGGRLHPTPEAETLFGGIERVYPGLTHLSTLMRNISLADGGLIRLVSTMPLMQRLIPEALALFHEQRPDIKISLRTIVKRELREWMDGQQFDIGLATLPVDYPASMIKPLASFNCVCVMPGHHRLAQNDVVTAQDLADEPFISIVPDTTLRLKVDRLFADLGIERRLTVETQSGAAICDLVAAGLGVSVVEVFTASGFKDKGVVLKPFRPKIKLDFGLLLPVQRPPSRPAELLIKTLQDRARTFGPRFGGG